MALKKLFSTPAGVAVLSYGVGVTPATVSTDGVDVGLVGVASAGGAAVWKAPPCTQATAPIQRRANDFQVMPVCASPSHTVLVLPGPGALTTYVKKRPPGAQAKALMNWWPAGSGCTSRRMEPSRADQRASPGRLLRR